jgi:hypothetical protein
MGKLLVQLRKDLALAEDATVVEVMDHMGRMLADDMTEEEKKKAEEEAAAANAAKSAEEEAKKEEDKEMSEVRALLKIAKPKPGAILTAVRTLTTSASDHVLSETALGRELAELRLSHKELSDQVEELRPAAAEATRLAAEAKATKKATFFDRQLHEGKLKPAERSFYEAQYDLNEDAVVKFFGERKPEIKLGQWPSVNRPVEEPAAGDPRERVLAEAQKLALAEKIPLDQAVHRVTA